MAKNGQKWPKMVKNAKSVDQKTQYGHQISYLVTVVIYIIELYENIKQIVHNNLPFMSQSLVTFHLWCKKSKVL